MGQPIVGLGAQKRPGEARGAVCAVEAAITAPLI